MTIEKETKDKRISELEKIVNDYNKKLDDKDVYYVNLRKNAEIKY